MRLAGLLLGPRKYTCSEKATLLDIRYKVFNFSLAFDCANAEPNGFFADPEQCDLYYECVDGVSTVKLCPDGLMFDDTNKIDAKCDYPFNVDCGKREYVRKLML